MRECCGEPTGRGESHRSLQGCILLEHLVHDLGTLGGQGTEEQRGDAEGQQRKLDIEQRDGARSQLECGHHRRLCERYADHRARHAVVQR